MLIQAESEYAELGENIRHWENLRWVSMTVFVGIMGGLFSGLVLLADKLTLLEVILVKCLGVVLVGVFWVQDERIVEYWKSFRQRAQSLEKELGLSVYVNTPARGWFSAGTAVRVLYVGFLIVWAGFLFR